MQRGVHGRLMDNSTSVREAAVELLGKFVLSRPQLTEQYYDMLIERILVSPSRPSFVRSSENGSHSSRLCLSQGFRFILEALHSKGCCQMAHNLGDILCLYEVNMKCSVMFMSWLLITS